jgi:Carboxypeptidase regulatory-like domain
MKRSIVISLLCFTAVAYSQETRSTLTGHVADPSGARVPEATIHVTNTDTGVATNVKSNSAGDYTVPFLQPGTYRVDATHDGFKNYTHTGLVLQTEQTVTENITLSVGGTAETVTVEGNTPMIDTATASTGQTLTAEEVEDLPSNGRSPLGFAHLEYGAVAKGKHAESQTTPFQNSTADDFSLGGGASSSNELTLNGVPNMEDSSRTAGFSPYLDAVDAVHVDEFSANAAMGDSSGGVVNITTKSGTNQFHGSLSEYYAGSRPLTAKPYFTPAGTAAPSTHFNQFGGTIGGPVLIPHVWNGRDRMFFTYAFEGYIGNSPATTITSVPTQAERNGDFSALLGVTTSNQLYIPNSGAYNGKTVTRSEIPGNVFSNAGLSVDPVAQNYLKLIPLPNYEGASTKPDGENNFFASDPTTNNYKSNQARIDVDVTHNNRLSFEAHRSNYVQGSANIFNNALTGTTATTVLWGGFAEDVHTFNPSTSLDVRLGFSRYENSSNPNSAGISPTSLGFPGYLAANSSSLAIPYLTFSDTASIPSLSANPGNQEYYDDIQLFSSFNKVIGRHTIKIGPDIRLNKDSTFSGAGANGFFTFKSQSGDPVTSGSSGQPQAFGGSLALFELGLPTSGSGASTSYYTINPRFQYNNWYFAGFAQDDWKILPNLTISMGIRLEHETPVVESQNRQTVGFNPTATNAATVQAAANYAKSPSPLLAASAFQPTGGVYYASSSQRNGYFTAPLYASPRVGFAYSPDVSHGTLAIRGGFGVYLNPFNDYNFGQSYGYTATSTFVESNLTNQNPTSTLDDPFDPNVNPIVQPYGSSLGPNTNLGSSMSYFGNVKVPYVEKAQLDVQKQFGRSWMVEAGYMFAHGVHYSFNNAISSTPLLPFLTPQQTFNATVTAELNQPITNPFKGLFPAATTPNGISVPNTTAYNTGATITTAQALQAYPEFSGVTEQLIPAQNSNFNALLLRLEKRMSYGLEFNINYEYSRQLGAQSQLNAGGPLWYGETSSDFPQHLSATVIYQLPFGHGRRFMNQSRVLDEVFGGYEVTGIYEALSGTPISWGNVVYNGNFSGFNNHPHLANGQPSFNTADFDRTAADQPNSYNYRTFPAYLLRSDGNNNFSFSLLKNLSIGEHVVIQPRVDAFNALNHVQFSSANVSPTSSSFGVVSSQLNSNRQLQGGIHFLF